MFIVQALHMEQMYLMGILLSKSSALFLKPWVIRILISAITYGCSSWHYFLRMIYTDEILCFHNCSVLDKTKSAW